MVTKWGKKRSVMRRYNLTSQIYDERYREEQEAKYKAALECAGVLGCGTVLDVGCGSGLFFRKIALADRVVVGIDISKGLLRLAKCRARELPPVFLVLADADHLPFQKEAFSWVFAFTVLQNMPNPGETLVELKRVSKDDAFFVVTGLKAAMPLEAFGDVLDAAGLQISSLRDDEALRCHVVICVRGSK